MDPTGARGDRPVVAIGGIGGSGTRVGAALLLSLGYHIGCDLNEPLDNLWFNLLFKRRSALLESDQGFERLWALFSARMRGTPPDRPEDRETLRALAAEDRLQGARDWLQARVDSFLDPAGQLSGPPWGWKEPNTHVFIDRLLRLEPRLLYIHFVRNPLDMALSGNQNQLENWGPVFLDRPVEVGPRDSLSYWCVAHRRFLSIQRQWPGRMMGLDFDALCADPREGLESIAAFIRADHPHRVAAAFQHAVRRPASTGRSNRMDLGVFRGADLDYLRSWGFAV